MELWAIRHGLGDPSKTGDKKPQGLRLDEKLSPLGAQQMRSTTQIIRKSGKNVRYLSSSPLPRAYLSAWILGRRFQLPIIVRDGLREVDFGELNGLSWKEIEKRTGIKNIKKMFRNGDYDFYIFGGESNEQTETALIKTVEEFKTYGYEKDDIMISIMHGGKIRALYGIYKSDEVPDEIPNGSIHKFLF